MADHVTGNQKGFACGPNIGGATAGNVKGGAMRRCCHREGNAPLNRYTAIKSHQFQRNLALVVIHGDDAVNLASLGL